MNNKTNFKELNKICNKCYNKLTARLLRQTALDILGNRCGSCGIDDPRVLQIDHIEGGGSADRKKIGVSTTYRQARDNPTNYQILCANCNWIKRSEEKEREASCHHDVELGYDI